MVTWQLSGSFLRRTNSFNETFPRVGIRTYTPKRWAIYRMFGTNPSCTPESHCGERAVARRAQEEYDRHRHYRQFWYRPWQSIPAGVAMAAMDARDAVWNDLTAPYDR
jgi:hypothetical protein